MNKNYLFSLILMLSYGTQQTINAVNNDDEDPDFLMALELSKQTVQYPNLIMALELSKKNDTDYQLALTLANEEEQNQLNWALAESTKNNMQEKHKETHAKNARKEQEEKDRIFALSLVEKERPASNKTTTVQTQVTGEKRKAPVTTPQQPAIKRPAVQPTPYTGQYQEHFPRHGADIIYQVKGKPADQSNCGRFALYYAYKMIQFLQNKSFASHAELIGQLTGIATNRAEFDQLCATGFPQIANKNTMLASDEIDTIASFIKQKTAKSLFVLSLSDLVQDPKQSHTITDSIAGHGILSILENKNELLFNNPANIIKDRFNREGCLHMIVRAKKAHWVYVAVIRTTNGNRSIITFDSAGGVQSCPATKATLETIKNMLK